MVGDNEKLLVLENNASEMDTPFIKFYFSWNANSLSLAIFSPRLTEMLTAGWERFSSLARAVAVSPSSRTS